MTPEFDYVVVGGGTAGCVVAARLAEQPDTTVLLVEAGERDSLWTRMPAAFRRAARRAGLTWSLQSEPEPYLDGRRLPLLAGRTLGGSSAINGLLYVRGQRRDFDAWAAAGANGWNAGDVRPWFEQIESEWPLQRVEDPRLLQADYARALADAGYEPLEDPVREAADGYFLPRITTDARGRRRSSAAQHELALKRSNITVRRGIRVTRVTIEGHNATGIEYHQDGRTYPVRARREVILAAGACHSPHLLMLSGIGDPAALEAAGVVPRIALPGVGQNLSNHASIAMRFLASKPLPAMQALRLDRAVLSFTAWALAGRGLFALQPMSQLLMLRSQPWLGWPDCQLTLGTMGSDADWWFPGIRSSAPHAFAVSLMPLRPESRGWVRLASSDPLAAPRVLTNLLADPADVAVFRDCVPRVRELFACEALAEWTEREWVPGPAVLGDEQIAAWLRRSLTPSGHPVGTCRIGVDARAVVDPELRVHGVGRLRVIDASVMPSLPGAGPYASTLMVAERGAAFLRGQLAPATSLGPNVVRFPGPPHGKAPLRSARP
jgi:choline dehydrogenase